MRFFRNFSLKRGGESRPIFLIRVSCRPYTLLRLHNKPLSEKKFGETKKKKIIDASPNFRNYNVEIEYKKRGV